MIQIKINNRQADKLTSLLLIYLEANDQDEEMRDLMETIFIKGSL